VSDSPAAAVLRQAAARVCETARGATRGPWAAEESLEHGFRVGTSDGLEWVAWTGAYDDEPDPSRADAAWIALMHTGLAEPLARTLEQAADAFEGTEPDADEPVLHLARIILGTTKETIS
jgi:hypothetical protein